MATLVLSTVGSALGGPVGGAIGALVGQSIDQELLAPPTSGPRVANLAVQTSSYGTQVPRIYGTMRIAGTVVWATDLVEHSSADGAKGQPDVTYTYTVSLAVALSSRKASSIGRIWADGNLLRGAAGDLKVNGTLRFYDGSEDQALDPLIASTEGIANTPAYRGLTLGVFEDLDLTDFSNRIPTLTFELIADEQAPTVGAVLTDASKGAISVDTVQTLGGYAAYGKSIGDALQPLVDCFAVELFDDGEALRGTANATPEVIGEEEFGNSADQQQVARLQREQASVRSLPATLRLTYYDPARDYQTSESRAAASEQSGIETQTDLAAVLDADTAKMLAQQMIAQSWAQRDKLTLRLPPKRVGLVPGTRVTLPLSPSEWIVDQLTVDGFVAVAELHPSGSVAGTIAGDPGRSVSTPDVVAGPIDLALLDVPDVLGLSSSGPAILLAASNATAGWKSRAVELSFGNQSIPTQTARSKSLLGQAVTLLGAGETDLTDEINSVDVQFADSTQWLTSCDDEGLAAGQNLAMLGAELIQFGQATVLGAGRFRLNRLLRGRGGTEWASGTHAIGETFCVLGAGGLQPILLPSWSIGAMLQATSALGGTASVLFEGEGVRPPSPIALSAQIQPNGDLSLAWIRRSRQGFAWIDGIDAPLGETVEQYRVTLTAGASSLDLIVGQNSATIDSASLAALGAGPVSIQVRQIGDFAPSHAAQISITLP